MRKVVYLLLLAGLAYGGWVFYERLQNPYGVTPDAPLGTMDKVEAHLTGNEMFVSPIEARVDELELPDLSRFRSQAQMVVYVGGRGNTPIILPRGGGKLSEFVAVAADGSGRVTAVAVRSDPNPPLSASGQFALTYWQNVTGGDPFFSPGGVEAGDQKVDVLLARPDTPGVRGEWKHLVVLDFMYLYAD